MTRVVRQLHRMFRVPLTDGLYIYPTFSGGRVQFAAKVIIVAMEWSIRQQIGTRTQDMKPPALESQ